MTVTEALAPCVQWTEPKTVEGNPFRLVCKLEPATNPSEPKQAFPAATLPPGLLDLWQHWKSAKLFADADYGQWGLKLLSPTDSAARTAKARAQRPKEFELTDFVIGEFLGDQELVVVNGDGQVLIALPLDGREDWYRAANDLADFFAAYVTSNGNKYWEARPKS